MENGVCMENGNTGNVESKCIVRDIWNGELFEISAVKGDMAILVPVGGGEPFLTRRDVLGIFYRKETIPEGN
jgi:hypothetical protein